MLKSIAAWAILRQAYDERILLTRVRLAGHGTVRMACHVHLPLFVDRDAAARIIPRRAELPEPKLLPSRVILSN